MDGHGASSASTDRPRLVRSRSGRLIQAPPEPEREVEPRGLSRRQKAYVLAGTALLVSFLAVLYVRTQGTVGNGGKLESILRDFGHVVREVRGPGLTGPPR
ncbi:MAG: hypothetical protein AAGB93_06835 [Planctomycetota bacterium]